MERGTVIDEWAVAGGGMTAQTRATTTAVTVVDIRILRPRRWLATIVGRGGSGGGNKQPKGSKKTSSHQCGSSRYDHDGRDSDEGSGKTMGVGARRLPLKYACPLRQVPTPAASS